MTIPPPTNNTNINQGLTGYLYTSVSVNGLNPSDRYPVIIDIATGKAHRILEPLLMSNGELK
jgi:hypothetical protein